MKVAIDSSVLVGLINPQDHRRGEAVKLRDALVSARAEPVYFDCVVAEAVSNIARRLHEKGLAAEVEAMLDRTITLVPSDSITWILSDIARLYSDALALIRSTAGELNFNDSLIALACRERGIPAIASFDADFDRIGWLRRLARPEDVTAFGGQATPNL